MDSTDDERSYGSIHSSFLFESPRSSASHSSSPLSPRTVRQCLERLVQSERLPTDHDRASSADEQPYAPGTISSSHGFRCPFAHLEPAHREGMLVALFGVLTHRYVREPEVALGLVSPEGAVAVVPMHSLLGCPDASVADCAAGVQALLDGIVSLGEVVEEEAAAAAAAAGGIEEGRGARHGEVDTADACAKAIYVGHDAVEGDEDGEAIARLPRTWPLLYFLGDGDPHNAIAEAVQSDVCLGVGPRGGYVLRYNRCLLSPAMAQAMLRSWETLLVEAARDTSACHGLVTAVSAADAQRLVKEWNQTEAAFAPRAGLHQLFEAQAEAAPERVAIVGPLPSEEEAEAYPHKVLELSYGEVERRANRMAHHLLLEAGGGAATAVVPESTIVAILLERSVEFYVAMLGVLKAGAAYLSIDPEYPDDRIQYMLEDSGAAVLITTTRLAARLKKPPPSLRRQVRLDDPAQAAAIAAGPATRPLDVGMAVDPEWLCYMIYTSGSTGKPKGVQISHANALNLVRAEEVIYCIQPSDRVLQGFSTSFDASVEEIWMAFNNGATLVVGTKEVMRSGPDFPHYLKALGVTCLSTVPTLLSTIPPESERALRHVRLIITGGEACSKELVNRWARWSDVACGGGCSGQSRTGSGSSSSTCRRFFNTYGPTEATVIATYKECFQGTSERMSIGKPLLNYQCYVLDDRMNLLPPGAVGELVIGGVSVSRRGYLNLPDKTAAVFKHDHLTGGPHPLYKSGDLARLSCLTGDIEYLGRADSQVKIRGYRVELTEIEAVLAELPGVKAAVVDVQQGLSMMKQIVAFVVPDATPFGAKPAMPDTAGILQATREKLPAFMIPSHVEVVASFPTLPSGKVDRRRLPQVLKPASRRAFTRSLTGSMGNSLRFLQQAFAGPATAAGGAISLKRIICDDDDDDDGYSDGAATLPPFEKFVAEAFEAVLGIPDGSIDAPEADFFDLGGNSLLVSLLVTRLRRSYPTITTRDVYSHTTVAGLAKVVERMAGATEDGGGGNKGKGKGSKGNKSLPSTSRTLRNSSSTASTSPSHANVHVPSAATTRKADLVQFLAMYFVAAYLGLNGLTVYILYFNCKDWPMLDLFLLLAALAVALVFAAFAIVVAAKWLVLGRVREGDYPLWEAYHLRFWFVQCLDNIFRIHYLPLFSGTPLVPLYYRALGCRVGAGVFIDGHVEGYDLVSIGDGTVLNCEANVSAMSVEGNYLKLRRVTVGQHATLGIRATVQCGATVGDGAKLEAMTLVPAMASIPPMQHWAGAPCAFKAPLRDVVLPSAARGTGPLVGGLQLAWALLLRVQDAALLLPFLCIIRRMPVVFSLTISEKPTEGGSSSDSGRGDSSISAMGASFLHLIWFFALLQLGMFLANTCLTAAVKRLLLAGMGERKEYRLDSACFLRRWAADVMVRTLATYTKQLRGSVYLPLWYRAMGTRMGRRTEISTYIHAAPDKLTLGDQAFVADDVILGMPHVDTGGLVTHDHVRIGHRAFVGNASVVQTGTCLPDGTLVGVSSLAPKLSRSKETYVGSPPLKIKREGVVAVAAAAAVAPGPTGAGLEADAGNRSAAAAAAAAAAALTYDPPLALVALRYLVEGLGFLALHLTLALSFAALYLAVALVYDYLHDGIYVVVLPWFVMAYAAVCALATLAWKWLVIGRFRPGAYPLYGTYVWRTEFVERIEESVLQAHAFPLITGTVWMQRVYQAMGVRMGRRAYLDYPCFCEPDLCTVGDHVNMERTATLQAHLFQDRVRTTGPVRIGHGCSLGAGAVVLVGGAMGDGCGLGALSLVMRSEELPAGTKWHGLPAEIVVAEEEKGERAV